MEIVNSISAITADRDNVAMTLMRIFEASGKSRQLLANLTGKEVDLTGKQRTLYISNLHVIADPDVIFRSNSVATKAVDYYMKLVGLPVCFFWNLFNIYSFWNEC
jgi:hypothetical protein